MDEIVATSIKPGWLKKDIAKKFRVSDMLISRICREAEKEPERTTKRREQKQLMEDKKEAIEDVTESLLQANVPIVRAQ